MTENIKITNNQNWLSIVEKYKTINSSRAFFDVSISVIGYYFFFYLANKSFNDSNYFFYPLFCILSTAFMIKMFSIFHDLTHSTFFKTKIIRDIVGFCFGVLTLTPYKHWRKVHLIHHSASSNLDKLKEVGDFPVYSLEEYKNLSKKEKNIYKFMRSPFCVLIVVPFIFFFILQRFVINKPIFNMNKDERISVYLTNITALLYFGLIYSLIGGKNFLFVQLPIIHFSFIIGTWLFYVQHQFEDTYWETKENYDYFLAAMKGSCFINPHPIFQWFLSNSGYHHIHHLAPQIPNYNLKKCYDENELFQDVSEITLKDTFRIFKYNVWDKKKSKLISFKEAELP
ncbi:MAG: fatty acid desaturase [Cyanobacteriota bacterium]